jgi:metallo-beta-lactamase family protein
MGFKVRHLGGERCVTGSCRLVQVLELEHTILVDCWMVQGRDVCVPIKTWPEQRDIVSMLTDYGRYRI